MRMARTTIATLTAAALAVGSLGGAVMAQDAAMAEPGADLKVMLLPKFTDNQVFQQANEGAMEAAAELGVAAPDFVGPAATDTGSAQVAFVVNAPTQEYDVLLISNNVGEEMADAAVAAQDAGIKVVTWDSPIASGNGEDVFIAQVDFDETGTVMADMARNILPDGGQMAVLSAKPESPNQNAWIKAMEVALEDPKYEGIELVDTVYGNDNIADSEAAAIGLIDQWPDLDLIMAPTTEGIKAAAKVVTDDGLCDQIKISGLGLPSEMESYTLDGCAPQFALWSFVDLGYLSYYVGYLLATGAIEGVAGETFEVGREISGNKVFEITDDPTRPDSGALRVLMGPFSVYDETNVSGS